MRAAWCLLSWRRKPICSRLCDESPLTDWKGCTLLATPGMGFVIPSACLAASAGFGAAPPPVHADPDTMFLQHACEVEAGELAALVGIEDLRRAVAGNSILERLDTESPPSACSILARPTRSACFSGRMTRRCACFLAFGRGRRRLGRGDVLGNANRGDGLRETNEVFKYQSSGDA